MGSSELSVRSSSLIGVDHIMKTVEIAQLDSLLGKEYKATFRSNKVIYYDNPRETVIDKDSYIQLDNKFMLELHNGLLKYRRQTDKLSSDKLNDVIEAYQQYHNNHHLDENKIVFMEEDEIEKLNNKTTKF